MFEVREWKGNKKKVVKNEIANLGKAFIELARLERDNPSKIYSIYRSLNNRSKNDYFKGGELNGTY